MLYSQNKPVTYGTLSIYPPTVDNYGIDSCSIMCLQTIPPIVVIAECTGKIYHAILLNENLEDDEKKVRLRFFYPMKLSGKKLMFACEVELHVLFLVYQ
jgi:hypothetical protein